MIKSGGIKMKKILICSIAFLLCSVMFLLPIKAAGSTVALKTGKDDNQVEAILELPESEAGSDKIVSLQVSFQIEKTKGSSETDEVSFQFDKGIKSVVQEYRYREDAGKDSGILTIYISGKQNLFEEEELPLGKIILNDSKKTGNTYSICVQENSLKTVNDAFTMEEILLDESETIEIKLSESIEEESTEENKKPENKPSNNHWNSDNDDDDDEDDNDDWNDGDESSWKPIRPEKDPQDVGNQAGSPNDTGNAPKPVNSIPKPANNNSEKPENNGDRIQNPTDSETSDVDLETTTSEEKSQMVPAISETKKTSDQKENKGNQGQKNKETSSATEGETRESETMSTALLESEENSESESETMKNLEESTTLDSQEETTVSSEEDSENHSKRSFWLKIVMGVVIVLALVGGILIFIGTRDLKQNKKS